MFGGEFSLWHMMFVLIIVLILFGNRLPSVMRSLGRGVVEFKKGLQDINDDVKESTAKIENAEPRKSLPGVNGSAASAAGLETGEKAAKEKA
jgi:sec-independent protein translocase protein TatA